MSVPNALSAHRGPTIIKIYFFFLVTTTAGTRTASIANPTAAEEPQPFFSGAVVSGVVASGFLLSEVSGVGALVDSVLVVVGASVTGAFVVSGAGVSGASVVSTTGSSPLKPYWLKSGVILEPSPA